MQFYFPNIKNWAINILVLLIILVLVKNNIDRSHTFSQVTEGEHYELDFESIQKLELLPGEDKINFYVKTDPRLLFSQELAIQNNDIFLMNDRVCGFEGSLENRKKLRWVIKTNEHKFYSFLFDDVSKRAPYYAYILIYSILLLLSLVIIGRIVPLKLPQYLIFLCGILYIFQFQLSEISYSILEMLFISIALYASYKKNILIFIISVIIALHSRESGILLASFWLLFNRSLMPIIVTVVLSLSLWLGVSNFDIFNCIFSDNFFISSQPQVGQVGFWSLARGDVSYLAFTRIIFEGFLIPASVAFTLFYFCKLENKNKILLLILVYLIIFLLATPILHHSTKLLLIPFLVLLSSNNFINKY